MRLWEIVAMRRADRPIRGPIRHWPEWTTYTVRNVVSGEKRNITCCGSAELDRLIEEGRFDENPTAPTGA
jgi:hypothetical protein